MLSSTVVCLLTVFYICVCASAPVVSNLPDESKAVILHSTSFSNPNEGSYAYSFDTSNGIKVEEIGAQKQFRHYSSEETSGTVSRGKYSFTFPDGTLMTVNWVADENGFQPKITYGTPTILLPQPDDNEGTTVNPFF